MGCANSKGADASKPAKLEFNAADLDDIDQSTHKKKKNVALPQVTATAQAAQPSAESAPN